MSFLLEDKKRKIRELKEWERKIFDVLMIDPTFNLVDTADKLDISQSYARTNLTRLFNSLEVPKNEIDKRGWIYKEYFDAYEIISKPDTDSITPSLTQIEPSLTPELPIIEEEPEIFKTPLDPKIIYPTDESISEEESTPTTSSPVSSPPTRTDTNIGGFVVIVIIAIGVLIFVLSSLNSPTTPLSPVIAPTPINTDIPLSSVVVPTPINTDFPLDQFTAGDNGQSAMGTEIPPYVPHSSGLHRWSTDVVLKEGVVMGGGSGVPDWCNDQQSFGMYLEIRNRSDSDFSWDVNQSNFSLVDNNGKVFTLLSVSFVNPTPLYHLDIHPDSTGVIETCWEGLGLPYPPGSNYLDLTVKNYPGLDDIVWRFPH